jgi:enamine deaminase RidA (YjgF/YER057c/UK114 family)
MSRLIFVPATTAADTGADVARQTTLALARIDEQLRAERSSLADAIVMTVYLRQASDFAAMNDA